MNLIDIHAHLEHEKFKDDLDKVIERARKAGVKIIINSGVNKKTNRESLELSEKYNIIKPSFGIYPIDALAMEMQELESSGFSRDIEKLDVDSELRWIEQNKDKCIAIGEIGLDYNWEEIKNDEPAKTKQKEIFRKILKLAKKIDKPVIVHSRKAEEDAIKILEEEKMKKAIMHCFSGKKLLIKRCVENKWFFSIPPIITRLQHFQLLAELVPIEQLLTETDSPYLSPVAGERNEPGNVAVTIKEIARIKGLDKKDVAGVIWENAGKVFEL